MCRSIPPLLKLLTEQKNGRGGMDRRRVSDKMGQRDWSSIFSSLVIAIFLLLSVLAFIPADTEATPGTFERTTLAIDYWGNVGSYSSIALDSNDKVHISYLDLGGSGINHLKYASNSQGGWFNMGIDWWDMGPTSSIAVDSNNKSHIAYQDITNLDLKYATDASGSWATYTLDNTNIGWYCSIAIDSNDKVHISYWDFMNLALKYATNAGGSWTNETVEGGNVGYYSSIAVDSNNSVHISHFDNTNKDLRYATNSGGSWNRQAIDTGGSVGVTNSIGIDSEGKLHISYYDNTNKNLKYVNNEGGSWNIQVIDHQDDVGFYSSLAIDPSDKIHISYYDKTNGDLKYATDVGGTWGYQTIDAEGDVGLFSSIAVDSQYRVHISYYDYYYEDLKYATGFFTVPSAPTNLDTFVGDGFANITWDAPSIDGGYPIDNYTIYRGDSPGTETLLTTVGNQGYFNDTSIVNGETYYYRVSAVNVVEESPLSEEVSAKPATTPEAPTDLQADSCGFQVNLSWNPPSFDGGSPITGYNVYRGETSDWMLLLATAIDQPYFNDTWVVKGNEYFYKVTAVNDMGESPMSSAVSAISATVPSQPENLQAEVGDSLVELSWNPPSDSGGSTITNYTIYRGTSQGGESFLIAIGDELYYMDSDLTNGQTYYYKVSAINGVGEGPRSNEAEAKPMAVPSAPEDFLASVGDSIVNLSWSYPSDDGGSTVTNFTVYRGNSSSSLLPLVTLGNFTEYSDTSVVNGETYYYQVAAVNTVGIGSRSDSIFATPSSPLIPMIPSQPQNPQADAGNGFINISWEAPLDDGGSPIAGYVIYRGNSTSSLHYLDQVGPSTTSFNDTSVQNEHQYYYRISAVNEVGEGNSSLAVSGTPFDSASDGGDLTLPIAIVIIAVLAIASIAVYMRRIR
jgi:fibronectin type 3 domain-containing protein